MAKSEDPDEMPHYAAFHQGLHCLLRQNGSSENEMQYYLEIITCDPSIYTMDCPDITVSNFMGNPIGTERVNNGAWSKISIISYPSAVPHDTEQNRIEFY